MASSSDHPENKGVGDAGRKSPDLLLVSLHRIIPIRCHWISGNEIVCMNTMRTQSGSIFYCTGWDYVLHALLAKSRKWGHNFSLKICGKYASLHMSCSTRLKHIIWWTLHTYVLLKYFISGCTISKCRYWVLLPGNSPTSHLWEI